MPDPYHLRRFVDAQAPVYGDVLAELLAGRKRSHWMWFVFPQVSGLGHSETARFYAIGSLDEARAYLGHEKLGSRLRECTGLVLAAMPRSAHAIFGAPDDTKFRSSMTLFDEAAGGEGPFRTALDLFFHGQRDPLTLNFLGN